MVVWRAGILILTLNLIFVLFVSPLGPSLASSESLISDLEYGHKAGNKSAVFFWPGSEVIIDGNQNYCQLKILCLICSSMCKFTIKILR